METNSNFLLCKESISGTTVRDRMDNTIGSIEDLMIDMQSGEVVYAILKVNEGFLNMGSKYFAIPLQAFEVNTGNQRMILDVEKERFDDAPGFDKDDWPRHPQEEFINNVYTFYNLDRYHHAL